MPVLSLFTNVFVYGTLKRGQCLQHCLTDQEFLGDFQTTPEYVMVSLGDYPGLVLPDAFQDKKVKGLSVEGELYRVDSDCLVKLDRVECVSQGMYRRRRVSLLEAPDVVAQAYFYQPAVTTSMICGMRW